MDQGPPAGRGCFARCRLHSLERWETLPPLCHVGEYASMEVPEIFAFEERFWAIFSTGSRWGVGLDTPERRAATGTFYLVAERWEGPYRRPADNLLLGAGEGRMDAYVARTVPWGGERLVYHHFAGALPAAGLPKVLRAEEERLFLAPWSGVQALWTAEADPGPWGSFPFGPAVPGTWEAGERSVRGECAWGADALLADAGAPDIDLEAEVTLLRGRRAGLAVGLRMDAESPGTAVLLDAERGEITVGGLERWPHACGPVLDGILDRVSRPVERGRAYRLRLLRRGRYLEFFVDGRLVFSTVLPDRPAGGALACVVESGSAEFRFSRLHAVEPLARG